MKTMLRGFVGGLLALVLGASGAAAQERAPFQRAELDQMLAPIALYPDALLSQILIASTYPLEVVQAARWSRARPGLKGRDAVAAADAMDWDPSVKSLTAFPQVLSMMDEQIEWTERLGDAFLGQQPDVMAAVQDLRRRAETAGNLRTDERMQVVHQDGAIVIEPPASGIVYVPYYVPAVAYGGWWWPDYPPVAFAPPVVTVISHHRPAFIWGDGILFSVGFFFGHFDWPRHRVEVARVHHHHAHARPVYSRTVWRHEPSHRRGVPYRHAKVRGAPLSRPASGPRHRTVTAPPPRAYRAAAPASVAAPRAATPPRRHSASAPQVRPDFRRESPAQAPRLGPRPSARPGPDRGRRTIEHATGRRPDTAYTHRAESRRAAPSAGARLPSASGPVTARARRPDAARGAPPRRDSKPARRGRDS